MSVKDWADKDYYKALGVPKDATAEQIKAAYKKLALKHHPDRNASDPKAEERFKAVSEAYATLGDEAKRREYDDFRRLGGAFARRPAPGHAGGDGFNVDFSDLLRGAPGAGRVGDFLGGLDGLFGARGRGGRAASVPRRGVDVEAEVSIGFEESMHGTTVKVALTGDEQCAACAGTGSQSRAMPRVCDKCEGVGTHVTAGGATRPCPKCKGRSLIVDDPCPTCHGSGKAPSNRTVNARVPAGVADGQRIRLRGKGAPGEHGGGHGDLTLLVHVHPHPVFGRSEDNLTLSVPVTFAEATLGAEISVPTFVATGSPPKPVTLRIPPGTASGRKFRVRGRGARRRDGTHGDLIVTIEVQVPRTLDAEARTALEAFAAAVGAEDVRADLFAKADAAAAPTTTV